MTFHSKLISIVTDKGLRGDRSFKVLSTYTPWRKGPFNKGAGYIGGFTFYVCYKCVDRQNMYAPRKTVQVGITRNANVIPWTRH
jgi:hypothetical protein